MLKSFYVPRSATAALKGTKKVCVSHSGMAAQILHRNTAFFETTPTLLVSILYNCALKFRHKNNIVLYSRA